MEGNLKNITNRNQRWQCHFTDKKGPASGFKPPIDCDIAIQDIMGMPSWGQLGRRSHDHGYPLPKTPADPRPLKLEPRKLWLWAWWRTRQGRLFNVGRPALGRPLLVANDAKPVLEPG